MYEKNIKRLLDIVLSIVILLIASPFLMIICFLIKIKLGGPIIFKQLRPGKNSELFVLYKFRTMIEKYDSNGNLLPDIERINKFGNFLRNTSLDEIPELINVIKGDMSIVGPRPLLVKYLEFYTQKEIKRHSVRPGITGLAQINGRNSANWSQKFEKDLEYINNITFYGDLKIILKTFIKVIKKDGIIIKQKNPILDLDDERRKPLINVKEISLEILVEKEENIKSNIKELLMITNIDNVEEIENVYNNMIKFKKDKTAILFGAFDKKNNNLVGFIWGYEKIGKLHINYFYINKGYRGKGVGQKLINSMYEKAKEKNIDTIELMVGSKNTNAMKFYKKQGFISERVLLCKKI